ncbi:conserved membrane protein of unknown function [Nitratireductor aquimarinus]|uniref:hypothetical protein n=1 Tax=Nitratireductor aquimarinus TaxID=889300 RepID=UPI003B5B3826
MSDEKRADDLEKASIDASVEGIKALLILNGGACIALLAFLSSTIGKAGASVSEQGFIAGAKSALIYFAVAAGLSVVTCLFAYLSNRAYSTHLRSRTEFPKHWTYGVRHNVVATSCACISLGLFFFGVYTVWAHIG